MMRALNPSPLLFACVITPVVIGAGGASVLWVAFFALALWTQVGPKASDATNPATRTNVLAIVAGVGLAQAAAPIGIWGLCIGALILALVIITTRFPIPQPHLVVRVLLGLVSTFVLIAFAVDPAWTLLDIRFTQYGDWLGASVSIGVGIAICSHQRARTVEPVGWVLLIVVIACALAWRGQAVWSALPIVLALCGWTDAALHLRRTAQSPSSFAVLAAVTFFVSCSLDPSYFRGFWNGVLPILLGLVCFSEGAQARRFTRWYVCAAGLGAMGCVFLAPFPQGIGSIVWALLILVVLLRLPMPYFRREAAA